MKMRDARSLPPVAQEDLRRKGIQAIRAGDSVGKVARRFGVSRQAVYNWVGRFESGGVPALRARKRGRAPARKLVGVQAATIVRLIKDRHPDQLKLPFYLWTREAVQALIRRKFNVDVSVWTVGRYLKRWGFTSQKVGDGARTNNIQLGRPIMPSCNWLKTQALTAHHLSAWRPARRRSSGRRAQDLHVQDSRHGRHAKKPSRKPFGRARDSESGLQGGAGDLRG